MRKHHIRLPIILVLIMLLSAADWAAAATRNRSFLWGSGTPGIGVVSRFSGDPDTPGAKGAPRAIPGSSVGRIPGDGGAFLTTAIWIRLLEARFFGR
jgi:hypothetical protein